jgi:hypothetical protein
MITNLIYHIFAIDNEMLWWNLRTIKKYLPIFNGKRVFTIAIDDKNNNPLIDKITSVLGSDNHYFVVDNNINATYGGTAPFFEISAPLIANTNENEFVFHGHTKGVSYTTPNPTVVFWTRLMYEYNLGRFDTVQKVLTTHDAHGIFKCIGTAFGQRVNWHYPGAFWWARHSSLFVNGWNLVERDACATEILPSQFIPSELAYNGLELPVHFFDPNKPYAADQLYNEVRWKQNLNIDDLTTSAREILYAD